MSQEKSSWDLSAWLEWLETLHPKEIDLGLKRTQQVAYSLKLTNEFIDSDVSIVTVAGTNGKGSFVAGLSALLEVSKATESEFVENSPSYGAYTSPHLLCYNERIRINGSPASDSDIIDAFTAIDDARKNISLSYFEFATLAALYLFKKYELKVWILEVGLGGRLDAVNILDPSIAVVTSIALDHQEWLGDTREKIAAEKAGIFRNNIPVIIADDDPPRNLVALATDHASKLYQIGQDFSKSDEGLHISLEKGQSALSLDAPLHFQLPEPSMLAVLQCFFLLTHPADTQLNLRDAADVLKNLQLPGRNQLLSIRHSNKSIYVLLDVAHNPAATTLLAKNIQERCQQLSCQKVIALCGMMADKDISESLAPVANLAKLWILVDIPDMPRAIDGAELRKYINAGDSLKVCNDPVSGFKHAADLADENDLICVFGSFYTVAPIQAFLQTVPAVAIQNYNRHETI